jgi:hypothetical protein
MNKFIVKRSFYDLLSISLILVFFIYFLLYKNKKIILFEEKIEKTFAKFGNKWLIFLDVLVILLVIFYTFKISNLLYTYPIRCRTADMLPVIRGAGEYILSLENPFNKTFCPWSYPYPYLPLMMVFYLPGILLKLDIRFISCLCFFFIITFIYYYHKKKGFHVSGFLIFLILITSWLFRFFLISVHTFPYLLILSVILFSLFNKKDKLFFFSSALAFATRRIFWPFFPIFLVCFLKQKKINLSHLKFFALGLFLGFFPAFLYPKSFVINQINVFQRLIHVLKKGLFLEHSLGFSYYFYDSQEVGAILQICFLILTYIFAIKYLKINNFWLFSFFITIGCLYFSSYIRPEEYYFLPLVVILALSPLAALDKKYYQRRIIIASLLIPFFAFSTMPFFPFISGKRSIINPIQGNISISQSGNIISDGYLELSIGENVRFKKDKKIILLFRRMDYEKDKPVRINININEKKFLDEVYYTRKVQIEIEANDLNKYFIIGSNYLEIELDKPESFALKIIEY